MPRLIPSLFICLLLAMAAGCGNKGPLTLPADTQQSSSDGY